MRLADFEFIILTITFIASVAVQLLHVALVWVRPHQQQMYLGITFLHERKKERKIREKSSLAVFNFYGTSIMILFSGLSAWKDYIYVLIFYEKKWITYFKNWHKSSIQNV